MYYLKDELKYDNYLSIHFKRKGTRALEISTGSITSGISETFSLELKCFDILEIAWKDVIQPLDSLKK